MVETRTETNFKPTLGLTGLTVNAMALIAPGAFLWLSFYIQATTGTTAPAMWLGILVALLLCLATAISYAELSKLFPGTGSSYYYAEQSFLNHEKGWKYARISKFVVGWASHLYYWIYPGVMVATLGIFCGYMAGTLWPNFMSASNPGPAFMGLVAIIGAFAISYIAFRGVTGSTAVSFAINVIQISALLIFSVMALNYRLSHKPGSVGWQWDALSGEAYNYQFLAKVQTVNGAATTVIQRDAHGIPLPRLGPDHKPLPYVVSYPHQDGSGAFLTHNSAASVVSMHNLSWLMIQAAVAIVILVGFESITSMAGEAKNPRRDIPRAVIISLLVQGAFCYLIEYFCANYFLSSGYTMQNAAGSAAPIGDMMVMVGDALFGPGRGRIFMLAEAATVFLAIIGTTLACINTGARVTYAMGKDEEVPEHFGLLHGKKLTPHRSIWALAVVSALVGCAGVSFVFADAGAPTQAALNALPRGFWSHWGYLSSATLAHIPNSLLTITLASNFGTFLLYGMTCLICLLAFGKREDRKLFKHVLIPWFGLLANLALLVMYMIMPFLGYGTVMEPLAAIGIALAWGIYGAVYFKRASRRKGREILLSASPAAAVAQPQA